MRRFFVVVMTAALALPVLGQEARPLSHGSKAPEPLLKPGDVRGHFVLDTIRSAVAVPQTTDRDRLRVLNSAVRVVRLVSEPLARKYARQGAQLESAMIARGETPELSLFGTGLVPCADMSQFVQSLPVEAVARAQEQLSSALQFCPKQLGDEVRTKVTQALDNGVLAPRPLLQLADAAGVNSRWAQGIFAKLFSVLPSGKKQGSAMAGDLASVFTQLAPQMDHDAVKKAGGTFLEWLGKLDNSSERDAAIAATTEAMKGTLGAEDFERAMEENPSARQVTQIAAQGAPEPPPSEPSEMHARPGEEDLAKVRKLPAADRAREAAARGFEAGTNGNRQLADRYFNVAYSALNDVWSSEPGQAAEIVSEVNDAAAQVDPVAALSRAQRLDEPGAQAIGMISVARVVAGHQLNGGREAEMKPAQSAPPAPPAPKPRR